MKNLERPEGVPVPRSHSMGLVHPQWKERRAMAIPATSCLHFGGSVVQQTFMEVPGTHRVQVPPYFGWSNGGEYVLPENGRTGGQRTSDSDGPGPLGVCINWGLLGRSDVANVCLFQGRHVARLWMIQAKRISGTIPNPDHPWLQVYTYINIEQHLKIIPCLIGILFQ